MSQLNELLWRKQVLTGCAIDSCVPAFAEMAGKIGYDIAWLDLEHYRRNPNDVESFCLACSAGGALPALRVADGSRGSIMHALEVGARLVIVPMVSSPETAAKLVVYGKFSPEGTRGYNGATRGMGYALGSRLELMQVANRQTYLFPQIETMEAVENCAAIVKITGITGALVGPADLSISAGMPLDFENPSFLHLYRTAIQTIRQCGKVAATATSHPVLVREALEAGVQILICASDTAAVREHMVEVRKRTLDLIGSFSETAAAARDE
jgi:4-hydroxy-2-oxoheptanedioate aldolase